MNKSNTNKLNTINKLIASILTFIGLPGQLIARALFKHGSLNKPYLLLFAIPPFSIIPTLAIWFDYIEDAEIKEKPFDMNLLIGMILIYIIPLVVYKKFEDQNKLVISIVIQIASIGIIHYIYNQKFNTLCGDDINDKYIINKSFTHALLVAPLSMLLSKLLLIIISKISDKYNLAEKKLFNLEGVNKLYLITSFSLGILYIFINMLYSSKKSVNKLCNYNPDSNSNSKIKLIHILLLLIINIILPIIIK